ncbi:MAG: hypothetical protein WBD07_02660 [Vicinamibacterales bacterium]
MRTKIVALCSLVLLSGGAVAPLAAQSLADVARQEEARRRAIRAPVRIITNTDLKPVLPPESAPAPATAAPDAAPPSGEAVTSADIAKPADAAAPAGEVKDQAYWSGRFKGLQTQLERDQTFADALQVQINSLTADVSNRNSAQTTVIENNRTKALAELDRLKKAIADDQKAITALQEEARQAGVPPGWVR